MRARAATLWALLVTFAMALALAVSAPLSARSDDADPVVEWTKEADRARLVIERDSVSNESLEIMRERLEELRAAAQEEIDDRRARIEAPRRQLDALGPAPGEGDPPETEEVAALRADLVAQLSTQNSALSAASAVEARLNTLLDEIVKLSRERLRTRILTRGPSPLLPSVWLKALDDLSRLWVDLHAEVIGAIMNQTERARALERAPIALLALGVGLALLIVARRRVTLWTQRMTDDPGATRGRIMSVGLAATAARGALTISGVALLTYALVESGLLGPKLMAFLQGVGLGAGILIATYALGMAYFSPATRALRLAALDDRCARTAWRAAMTLAAVVAIGTATVYALNRLRFDIEALIVVNFALTLVASGAMLRLRGVFGQQAEDVAAARDAARAETIDQGDPPEDATPITVQLRWLLRLSLLIVAIVSPTLAGLGYLAASYELTGPYIRTLGVIGMVAMLFRIAQVVAEGGAKQDGALARLLRFAPIIVGALSIILAAPLLAMAWGASAQDVVIAANRAMEGFVVSGVRIQPLDFATFVLVFGIGYALTGLLQRVLKSSVLPQLGVDHGARSALSAGVGYVGVFIAALIAITMAGIDLSNLAIVAGALSVGVGFGLQTIVNNFVSGIILLIERPIRVGDWIEVNGVHGTVKNVRVRSTEIETFDRSDYIVPNSDLIAAPVTNYTHGNSIGRVIVPVGVSYAEDPERIRKMLSEIAEAHAMVLRRPAPSVLFRRFGDSSLDFEIRAFLRDVNYVLSVGSDLNFAIAARFKAEGVEIPFPQRDLWLRNPEALREARREPPGSEETTA